MITGLRSVLTSLWGLSAVVMLATGSVIASPGAHGPGGEHLDAPGSPAAAQVRPRLEAATELYELVAELAGGELSILIDRFETNEPVSGAQVEVESGGLKAIAKFHADHGDYAVDDPALIKQLQQPGEHALVFVITAGSESDLLNGTLVVKAAAADSQEGDHGHELEIALAGGVLGFLMIGLWLWRRRHVALAGSLP